MSKCMFILLTSGIRGDEVVKCRFTYVKKETFYNDIHKFFFLVNEEGKVI